MAKLLRIKLTPAGALVAGFLVLASTTTPAANGQNGQPSSTPPSSSAPPSSSPSSSTPAASPTPPASSAPPASPDAKLYAAGQPGQ